MLRTAMVFMFDCIDLLNSNENISPPLNFPKCKDGNYDIYMVEPATDAQPSRQGAMVGCKVVVTP